MSKQLPRIPKQFLRWHNTASKPRENYYKLLGLTESFNVNSDDLSERFKYLQRQWHPDKWVSTKETERQGAADMSARINEAYSVLRVPYKRAKHLLQIRAEHSHPDIEPIDDVQLDPDFLMWVVEMRETVADAAADEAKLAAVKQVLEAALEECLTRLAAAFENDQLQVAAEETAKLQYLRRIEQAIHHFSN